MKLHIGVLLICLCFVSTYCFNNENINEILENMKNLQNDPEAMKKMGEKLIKHISKNQKGKHPEMFPVAGTIIRNSPILRDVDSL
ncbi:hypothetical protein L3Y34_016753 [Caenorhabditis briggsae]|uniref:Uncharacterized protein n=1 Tax=Caenorhabditis briggsae TaxID=6238 RepID=A0AAE9DX48_CAEBR|nr:hypothetical protein L3Y34_016753 [Caenorhabditis briggsae]